MGLERFRRRLIAPSMETWRDATVTSAQVLALFTTPVSILPAPGAGKINLFRGAVIHKPAGTAYTVGTGGNIVISYTNASGLAVAEEAPTGFADQATAQTREMRKHMAASGDSSVAAVANAALVIHQLTANMTAGTSPIKLRVFYITVPSVIA
jgi:hypothetical protein